jgi:hypothetical protein
MIREIDIVRRVNEYLKEKGYICRNEVSVLERRIDVVGVKNKKIVTIEVKVRNWKKALQQAIIYKLCSHYVYVAFWCRYLPKDLSYFEKYGIGVMSVDNSVKIIKCSKRSRLIHKSLLMHVIKQVRVKNE